MPNKKLILITNSFPSVNSKEKPFVKPEVDKLLESGFSISYLPFYLDDETEFLTDRESLIDSLSRRRKYYMAFNAFSCFFKNWFWSEIRKKFREIFFSRLKLVNFIKFSIKASLVESVLKKTEFAGVSIVYTFWCTGETVGLINFKNFSNSKFLTISRMHSYDFNEDHECNGGYIPYRENIINNLDVIVVLSNEAKSYLGNLYKNVFDKIMIYPLGTGSVSEAKEKILQGGGINFFSCSYPSYVKRLDRILSVLSTYAGRNPSIKVYWKHIGCDLKETSLNLDGCPNNLNVIFLGRMSEKDIKRLYLLSNNSVFICMSDYEGQPVSIMEAMSCAIPIISTNVGGIQELLGPSGILLDNQCDDDCFVERLEGVLCNPEVYRNLSSSALQQQVKCYDVNKNNNCFAFFLDGLV